MTTTGVILYGPPASGKDTITAALNHLDDRFTLVRKLKLGTGRSTGYKMVTGNELATLRVAGRLAVETHRYGNVYAVDRMDIEQIIAGGGIPLVHMGNLVDLQELAARTSVTWLRVKLWTTRQVCEERSRLRGDLDTARRLKAWDETHAEVENSGPGIFGLFLRTDRIDVNTAAQEIMRMTIAAGAEKS